MDNQCPPSPTMPADRPVPAPGYFDTPNGEHQMYTMHSDPAMASLIAKVIQNTLNQNGDDERSRVYQTIDMDFIYYIKDAFGIPRDIGIRPSATVWNEFTIGFTSAQTIPGVYGKPMYTLYPDSGTFTVSVLEYHAGIKDMPDPADGVDGVNELIEMYIDYPHLFTSLSDDDMDKVTDEDRALWSQIAPWILKPYNNSDPPLHFTFDK